MKKIFKKFSLKEKTKKFKNLVSGFTIIETMVAMTIFLIVIMVGSGALINAYSVGNKSKGMRIIMDSLSSTMDEMAREIRMGHDYRCTNSLDGEITPQSGEDCWALVFESSEGLENNPSDQVIYFRYGTPSTLAKTDGTFSFPEQLIPGEVKITAGGFSVLGAESPLAGDSQQPFVVIRLAGTITYKRTTTPFSLQTSVSQRANDLEGILIP